MKIKTNVLELMAAEMAEQEIQTAQELASALRNDMTLEDVGALLQYAELDLDVVYAA